VAAVVDRLKLAGIITDGGLAAVHQGGGDAEGDGERTRVETSPTIGPDDLAAKAVEMMERFSITTLVVVEGDRNIRGVIHLHDLLKSGIV
jgi:arabinose-5-phosphate isomerase